MLIFTAGVAVLIWLRPMGSIVLTLVLLVYVLALAIGDLATPFRRRRDVGQKSDHEYYSQFEPRSKITLMLVAAAIILYITGWLIGAYAEPGKLPIPTILIADIAFTVVGLTFCFYARQKSQSRVQTGLTWIPLSCWLLHSIILLGHGFQIERMSAG